MTNTNTKRKIFYLNDDTTQPVSAAGILIYKITEDNDMELLITDSRGNYEEFGGRVDTDDETIFETAARETYEESNGLFKMKSLIKRLINADYVYNARNKYITYIVKANKRESELQSEDFGNKEIHDNIIRRVKWMKLDKFLSDNTKIRLNYRICNKSLFYKLRKIYNNELTNIVIINEFSSNDTNSS